MFDRTPHHLSDRELLLIANDDSSRDHTGAWRHLGQCASCDARRSELARQLAEARTLTELALPLPPADAARSRLRMQLAALGREPRRSMVAPSRVWAFGAAVAIAVLGVAWLLDARPASSRLAIFLLPRADLTPGATRTVAMDDICGEKRTASVEAVPAAVQQRIFASYGADVRQSSQYELDYLITPELGGTPDPRNLWPQAFTNTLWNAFVKDELELHLHQQVCAGQIALSTAQQEIAGDWIASYKRHFRTERPRRDYTAFPLTSADGAMLRAELDERGVAVDAGANGVEMLAALRMPDQRAPSSRWFVRD